MAQWFFLASPRTYEPPASRRAPQETMAMTPGGDLAPPDLDQSTSQDSLCHCWWIQGHITFSSLNVFFTQQQCRSVSMKLCCHPPLRWPNGATFVLEQVRIWTAAGGAAAEPVNSVSSRASHAHWSEWPRTTSSSTLEVEPHINGRARDPGREKEAGWAPGGFQLFRWRLSQFRCDINSAMLTLSSREKILSL